MKKLLFALSILALALLPSVARAQAGHEYSPLTETTVNYKNWKLPNLTADKSEDLRELMAGKKLVMIVYFAPWCGNWKNEAPIAAKLYEKYKAQGFQVIGISEYASKDDVRNLLGSAASAVPNAPAIAASATAAVAREKWTRVVTSREFPNSLP